MRYKNEGKSKYKCKAKLNGGKQNNDNDFSPLQLFGASEKTKNYKRKRRHAGMIGRKEFQNILKLIINGKRDKLHRKNY